MRAVLQIYPDDLVALFFSGLEIRDVTFFLQDSGNLHLQPGSRNVHLLVPRLQRVAHPRQHICDRIGQPHRLLLLSPPVRSTPRGEPAAARLLLNSTVILSETSFVSRRIRARRAIILALFARMPNRAFGALPYSPTTTTSTLPESPPAVPTAGSTCGTSRTCADMRAAVRSACSDCACAWKISVSLRSLDVASAQCRS